MSIPTTARPLAPRAPAYVPVGRQGTAWRWLADQVASDPRVRATGAKIAVAGGGACESLPGSATQARVWLDPIADDSSLYAGWGSAALSYRTPVLFRIEAEAPAGRPPEDLLTLYERVEQAAFRAVMRDRAAARAHGVAWLEPGIAPRGTPSGGLVGAVRIVVFTTRPSPLAGSSSSCPAP